jgi:membrane-bound lytic murein transglycosylase D
MPNREASMLKLGIALLMALGASAAWAAADDALPLPASLEPNYRFWVRIYSEIDGQGGLIHDDQHLDIVYEVVRFPPGLSYRTRERRVARIKKRYRTILLRLGKGQRNGLSDDEARVLALWPEGVSDRTLARAAHHVRFQAGQADRFREGVARSGKWLDHIEAILAQYGVPPELAALPHVESSFNPRAYSRVGAAGLWQFTRSTGRLYLRIDHVVDQRMDPYVATDAAARLLRDNYRRLGTWPLAITAYNHGVAGMARAVSKHATRDIGVITREYDGRTFGFASRNFYSEFLAASEVAHDAERYFGYLQPDPPLDYEILETDAFYSAATLARVLGIDPGVLREHNLALRPSVWSGAKLVPRGYPLRIPRQALSVPLEGALASIPASERLDRQHRDRFHKVHRGETLSRIARRYHTSERELVALNNLRSRHRIRAGQVLRLPDAGRPPTVVGRREVPEDGLYRVERGDNLWVISQRFGVSEDDLARWNSLRNRNRLSVGQALRVAPAPAPTVVASAASSATDAAIAVAEPGAQAEVEAEAEIEAQAEVEAEAEIEAQAEVEAEAEIEAAQVEAEAEAEIEAAQVEAEAEAEIEAVQVEAEAEAEIEVQAEAEAQAEPAAEATLASIVESAVALVEDSDASASEDADSDTAEPELAEPGGAAAAATLASALPPPPVAAGVPVPDPSDYEVHADHSVTVQAEETLGHYAEWLELPTSRLRHLNHMRYGTPLAIGRKKKLDFSRVSPAVFEQRRLAYHRELQEEFFDAWVVAGTTSHSLGRGESLWYIAHEKYELPIWLLRQYNPDVDFGDLHAGTLLVIPTIEPRNP